MKVQLLDIKAQYDGSKLRDDIIPIIDEICSTQTFIGGKRVDNFEKAIAKYCGCKYACGVSSGSDALIISLMAEGIGDGDEVITTPFTFFATAGAIWRTGAKPVFVDIDAEDFNINPDLIEEKVTSKTKAIIPVHLYGQMAKMDMIMGIAQRYNLVVIEDGAQAIGSEYLGKRAGSYGDYGCFSFYPSKNLGAFGDGGIVTTSSKETYEMLKMFRNHGADPQTKYFHKYVGGNFRLDAIQAAILHVKLKHLDTWSVGRQENAKRYTNLFKESKVVNKITLPINIPDATRHIYNQYCILIKDGQRDKLQEELSKSNVGSFIYYPLPLHLQECFESLGHKEGDFPVSEKTSKEILALPIYPELTVEQQEYVVTSIEQALL